MTEGKKRGPKTDNPKDRKISIKLDQESSIIMDTYCKEKSVSMGECVRQGIKKLKKDLDKK